MAIEGVLADLPTRRVGLFVGGQGKGQTFIGMAHHAMIVEDAHDLAVELHRRRRLRMGAGRWRPKYRTDKHAGGQRQGCEAGFHSRSGSAGPSATVNVNGMVRT